MVCSPYSRIIKLLNQTVINTIVCQERPEIMDKLLSIAVILGM